MNVYDKYFTFRMAHIDEVDQIMNFIKCYWDAEHILANNKDFFLYHYGDSKNSSNINVFLMLEKNDRIAGMIGQVIYGTDSDGVIYFSNSILKVRNDIKIPMCGVEMQKRMLEQKGVYKEFSCGTNPTTALPVYDKVLKYNVGLMKLFYLKNTSKASFEIIKTKETEVLHKSNRDISLVKRTRFNDISYNTSCGDKELPYKSKKFLQKRYFEHPIWEYLAYEIFDKEESRGIIIFRQEKYKNSSILFWVDFIGHIDVLQYLGKELQQLLLTYQAECIHLMEIGIPDKMLLDAGFMEVDISSDEVVIPTYFDPFYMGNVENYYIRSDNETILFKATGDQDNPRRELSV